MCPVFQKPRLGNSSGGRCSMTFPNVSSVPQVRVAIRFLSWSLAGLALMALTRVDWGRLLCYVRFWERPLVGGSGGACAMKKKLGGPWLVCLLLLTGAVPLNAQ